MDVLVAIHSEEQGSPCYGFWVFLLGQCKCFPSLKSQKGMMFPQATGSIVLDKRIWVGVIEVLPAEFKVCWI